MNSCDAPSLRESERPGLNDWLKAVAQFAGYSSAEKLVSDTGVDCWLDYFDDGYSPSDAWAEDCSYG